MRLSKEQLAYIKLRRMQMDAREKDIKSFGDYVYKSRELTQELIAIYDEKKAYNFFIKLNNVELMNAKKHNTND